jgi:hypothetical protein
MDSYWADHRLSLATMRNPINAVSDTLVATGLVEAVRDITVQDAVNPRKWTIRFESKNNALIRSFLVVEVIEEDDGDASVCVLRRFNVGRRAMVRIMNTLVDQLDDEPILAGPLVPPPGGAPPEPQQ